MSTRPRWSLVEIQTLAAKERLILTHAACDYFSTRTEALNWIHGVNPLLTQRETIEP